MGMSWSFGKYHLICEGSYFTYRVVAPTEWSTTRPKIRLLMEPLEGDECGNLIC